MRKIFFIFGVIVLLILLSACDINIGTKYSFDQVLDSISIQYAEGDSATSVTKSFVLPKESELNDKANVSWESMNQFVIDNNGNVNRQEEDVTVTLGLTVMIDSVSRQKLFEVTVIGKTVYYEVAFIFNEKTTVVEVAEGHTISELEVLVKEGYRIEGWYLENSFINQFDFETKIFEDVVIYAKLIINEYRIEFDSNGGTAVDSITQEYLTVISQPENPTLEGFSFGGWFLDPELTIEFVFELMTYENITVYAKWNEQSIYEGYYSGAGGLMGNDLKLFLRTIISVGFSGVSYGETRYILNITDRDPNNPNNVILVYRGTSVSGIWDSGATWNREHVWPQSLLGGKASNSRTNIASDLHSLKPANPSENSSRSNRYFDDSGVSGSYEPRDEVKGDVARILFYKVVKYEELELVNSVPIELQMGNLDTLLRWHLFDPVDGFERNRNNVIFSYQNNRNPFIDHPEFVEKIWGTITLSNNSTLNIYATGLPFIVYVNTYELNLQTYKKNSYRETLYDA